MALETKWPRPPTHNIIPHILYVCEVTTLVGALITTEKLPSVLEVILLYRSVQLGPVHEFRRQLAEVGHDHVRDLGNVIFSFC